MHAARCGAPVPANGGAAMGVGRAAAEEERSLMRVQQESEYEAGLRADEEKARQEAMEERRKARQARRIADDRERAARRLGTPPDPDGGEATTRILVRLLDGQRISRRFLASAGIARVFDFVDVSVELPPEGEAPPNISLVQNHPHATIGRPMAGTPGPTLASLGLVPDASLFVEEQEMAATREDDGDDGDDRDGEREGAGVKRRRVEERDEVLLVSSESDDDESDAPSTAPSGRGASGGADVVVISDDETDGGDSQRGGDSRRGGDGKAWPCAVCTFLNAASKVSCEVCTAARQ